MPIKVSAHSFLRKMKSIHDFRIFGVQFGSLGQAFDGIHIAFFHERNLGHHSQVAYCVSSLCDGKS